MIPRFGDSYSDLPARCLIAMPVLSPREWTRFPVYSAYEALVSDLMGMAVPVPGHPASCARESCGHAQVWHQHRTKHHKCQAAGCPCTALIRQDISLYRREESSAHPS